MIPILAGELDRDDVHRHRARCQQCGRRCFLGPRQRQFWEEHADALVRCIQCGPAAGDLLTHLGNPELRTDGTWPAGEVRPVRRRP